MKLLKSSLEGFASPIRITDPATTIGSELAPVTRSWFFRPEETHRLMASRIELPAHSVVAPHFHVLDQFQIFVHGSGHFGKKPLAPITIHYADAFSPYGPIVCGAAGVKFFILRLQRDLGAFCMPQSRHLMRRKAGRNVVAEVSSAPPAPSHPGLHEAVRQADGLAAWRLDIPEGAQIELPSPAEGGGQYALVTSGSARIGPEAYPLHSLFFMSPEEAPLRLCAGSEGLGAVIVQYPRASWEHRRHEATLQ